MSASRRLAIVIAYLGYSTFWGFLVLKSLHLDKKRISDMVLAILAGPSIGLSRGHGAEFWLFGSLVLVPLLLATMEAKSLLGRLGCASAFALLWGGLGIFIA
jgi:hypothetical protein